MAEDRDLLTYKEKRYFLLAGIMILVLSYLGLLGATLPPNEAKIDITLQEVGVFIFLCGISYAMVKHGFTVVKIEISKVEK